VDIKVMVSYFLELLAVCLQTEQLQLPRPQGQSVLNEQACTQIVELCLSYMELTHAQQVLFVEDGNEYVSRDLDEISSSSNAGALSVMGSHHGDHADGAGDSGGGMRNTGVVILKSLCQQSFGAYGMCKLLDTISQRLLSLETELRQLTAQLFGSSLPASSVPFAQSLTSLRRSPLGNRYVTATLQAESLLWALGEVGQIYVKRVAAVKAMNQKLPPQLGIDPDDPGSLSNFLSAYPQLGSQVKVSPKELHAVNCMALCPLASVRSCVHHMIRLFTGCSSQSDADSSSRCVMPDIICGRAVQVFTVFDSLFDVQEAGAIAMRANELIENQANAVAVRIQSCNALSSVLHHRFKPTPHAVLLDRSICALLLRTCASLCGLTNSNTASLVLEPMNQLLGLLVAHSKRADRDLVADGAETVMIVDVIIVQCLSIWRACDFDSLCIDAVCDTVLSLAGYAVNMPDAVTLLLSRLLEMLASVSASSAHSAGVPLTSVEMFVELVGKVAVVAIDDMSSSQLTATTAMSCVNALHSLVMVAANTIHRIQSSNAASSGSSSSSGSRKSSRETNLAMGTVKSCLISVNHMLSRSEVLPRLLDYCCKTSQTSPLGGSYCPSAEALQQLFGQYLVPMVLRILQEVQTSSDVSAVEMVSASPSDFNDENDVVQGMFNSECCGPCIGILCHLLLHYQPRFVAGSDSSVAVRAILDQLVNATAHEDNTYIQNTAVMGLVHLIARCSNGSSGGSISVGQFAQLLSTISFRSSSDPAAASSPLASRNPLMHLLDMWCVLHARVNSTYCKRVSFLGLLNIIQLFSQHGVNYPFALKLLRVAVQSYVTDQFVETEEDTQRSILDDAIDGHGLRSSSGPRTNGDGDDDDASSAFDGGDYEDEYDDFNVADENVISLDAEDGDQEEHDDFDDPFCMYQSGSGTNTQQQQQQRSAGSKAQSGDLDDIDTVLFISDNLLYTPHTADKLNSVDISESFKAVVSGLLTSANGRLSFEVHCW
jgi:hypothetical protein